MITKSKIIQEIQHCMEMQLDFLKGVDTNLEAEAVVRGESYERQWKLGAAQELCRDVLGMLESLSD